jgi:TRAP-type C4-dicarboxylate transport system permease large subunit
MDDASAFLLCAPILAPILKNFGVDPIHFASIMGINIGIGLLSPPCAPCLYFGVTVMKTEVREMLPTTMKLLVFAWIPTLILVTYFPEQALWLPRKIMGSWSTAVLIQ